MLVKLGDKVSEGSPIVLLEGERRHEGARQRPRRPQRCPQHGAGAAAAPAPAAARGCAAAGPAPSPAPAAAGLLRRPCEPRRAPHRARARRRSRHGQGHGREGRITKEDVKGFLARPPPQPAGAAPSCGGGMGIPEIPARRFLEFGPVETKPLAAHQEDLGPASAPRLAQRAARHPHGRGGHHRDSSRTARSSTPRARRRATASRCCLPDQGRGRGAEAVPGLQCLAVAGEGRADPQAVLQHRRRGRHAGRPRGAGDQGRRPQGHHRDQPGARRASRRRRATASSAPADMQGATFTISSLGGIGGTAFTPIVNAPEVAILGVVRSKMAPVWDGKRVQAAPDAAALALLRPPRDRRRARGALHPPPRHVLEDVRRARRSDAACGQAKVA